MTSHIKNCDCRCEQHDNEFDSIVASELVEPMPLDKIVRMNIGWFTDKSIANHDLKDWNLNHSEGIYILWHKSAYCVQHEHYQMRAMYVGKGNIGTRFRDHWKNKDFSEELLIYFTYIELSNRLSKYIEQLFLDVYNFPLNRSENTGTKALYKSFTQFEID